MENKPILPNKLSKRQQIENGTYIPVNDISNKEEKRELQGLVYDDEIYADRDWTDFSSKLDKRNRIEKGENPRKGEGIVYHDKFWDWGIKLDKDT